MPKRVHANTVCRVLHMRTYVRPRRQDERRGGHAERAHAAGTARHAWGPTPLYTQELLFAEIVFGVLSKVYLDAISAKYKGYAQWSLPLPIPPSAESFINAVLFSGVLLPMGLTLYCSTVGMTFVYMLVCACTVGIMCVCVCPVWVWCGLGFRVWGLGCRV